MSITCRQRRPGICRVAQVFERLGVSRRHRACRLWCAGRREWAHGDDSSPGGGDAHTVSSDAHGVTQKSLQVEVPSEGPVSSFGLRFGGKLVSNYPQA